MKRLIQRIHNMCGYANDVSDRFSLSGRLDITLHYTGNYRVNLSPTRGYYTMTYRNGDFLTPGKWRVINNAGVRMVSLEEAARQPEQFFFQSKHQALLAIARHKHFHLPRRGTTQ